ncbi:bifunctional isocitrate dehydrogenase kinase/phosphatase [Aquitalea sp. LB_tupeE]|uniref:bifunctional isocitrate dehydrogenase kinase/phosphatase n=1 Tax=Aquitalea sp. LB_tupeE TaxID=2748078 RepID=UPI0015BC34E2|nr:bifunctional isocitrate dehydrogenase kinase/phosphatase [Aquitalea sp. LB_tupeE]NWK78346.1 bifunctional isocitrate dehydrogenase kinase/phosphatase [Aquitalea sp. LB_tupeE]
MQIPEYYNPVARDIAQALVAGFNKHYRLFRACSKQAKLLFERADWQGVQQAIRDRIQFYDERVDETVGRLHHEFHADLLDDEIWQQAKLYFIGLLTNHKQPELAETFFNSVFTRMLHRDYFNNDFIFIRPAISTEYIESDPPCYRSYYPAADGLRQVLRQMVRDFAWQLPFACLSRDLARVLGAVKRHFSALWPVPEANLQIQVLSSAFYRNKAAYIFGKVINGGVSYPFAVPVLRDENSKLYLDTVLLEPWRIGVLFSFSRAYFLVDMEVPSAYVQFLRSMLPSKTKAELYTMLGLQKQGKNTFYRDFMQHLQHSNDQFVIAPGIRGLVMLVFTLPSYPYVFKLIKDVFGGPKEMDRDTVKRKYRLVKRHDRVGRMADTLEFSNVAFPRSRFTVELLNELRSQAASMMEETGDSIVIRHLYIERRMKPLNIYLMQCDEVEKERVIRDYGMAIRELASANIFPGDMLFKNFGVTRYGRVIFYDYDEIEYMTDCHFRRIPPAPNPEMELSGEVWYPVGRHDVFPEEFATFLLGDLQIRKTFLKYHRDLLDPLFWQQCQQRINEGVIEDFFPYPVEMRFGHLPSDA